MYILFRVEFERLFLCLSKNNILKRYFYKFLDEIITFSGKQFHDGSEFSKEKEEGKVIQ